MKNKEAITIIKQAWTGRIDAPDFPDFDDINMAIYFLEKNIDILEAIYEATSSEDKDFYYIEKCRDKDKKIYNFINRGEK